MISFKSGQTAHCADTSLKSALKTRDAAQQCAVLWFQEILERKLYEDLGYSTINQYARQELGFSKSHIGDFLHLCRTFKKLPAVKEAVKSGKLPYTSARVLARVADEKNQEAWTRFALDSTRRELEIEVKRARQEAADKQAQQPVLLPELKPDLKPGTRRPAAVVPVRVSLEMSPTQLARYEGLWERIRKQRQVSADPVEALLEIMASFLEEESSGQRSARADLSTSQNPPVQIHIHKCEDCGKATVQTSRGELEIGAAALAQAECDCRTSRVGLPDQEDQEDQPAQPNKASIAPSVRRQVLARARYRCQSPGCHHTRFLEVHHLRPRHLGGTNSPENLQVLCSACHRLIHRHPSVGLGILVKSPGKPYRWKNCSGSRANGLIFPESLHPSIHHAERLSPPWPRNAISYSGPPVTWTTARPP